MSREIKFRGRRVDNGNWVCGQYFKTPLTDENSGTTPDAGWFFLSGEPRHCIVQDGVSFVIDEKTVSEYTGLCDKNGTEIYEGDILNVLEVSDFSTQEYKSPVEFIESGFLVTEPNETQVPLACFYNPNGSYPLFEIEIIGNICENADLEAGA